MSKCIAILLFRIKLIFIANTDLLTSEVHIKYSEN
nr:MAG TPA: hypothetical protein [Bacteriophage sp.]